MIQAGNQQIDRGSSRELCRSVLDRKRIGSLYPNLKLSRMSRSFTNAIVSICRPHHCRWEQNYRDEENYRKIPGFQDFTSLFEPGNPRRILSRDKIQKLKMQK